MEAPAARRVAVHEPSRPLDRGPEPLERRGGLLREHQRVRHPHGQDDGPLRPALVGRIGGRFPREDRFGLPESPPGPVEIARTGQGHDHPHDRVGLASIPPDVPRLLRDEGVGALEHLRRGREGARPIAPERRDLRRLEFDLEHEVGGGGIVGSCGERAGGDVLRALERSRRAREVVLPDQRARERCVRSGAHRRDRVRARVARGQGLHLRHVPTEEGERLAPMPHRVEHRGAACTIEGRLQRECGAGRAVVYHALRRRDRGVEGIQRPRKVAPRLEDLPHEPQRDGPPESLFPRGRLARRRPVVGLRPIRHRGQHVEASEGFESLP